MACCNLRQAFLLISIQIGRGHFGPVRTFGAIPPNGSSSRRAPPVHEATGGYAVRCPSVYDMEKSI